MTDIEFIALLDRLHEADAETIEEVVAASGNDPLRRRFVSEALAFHGLTSTASLLWAASPRDRGALTAEVLAYFATTPLRPDTPEWLGQSLHRIANETIEPENRARLMAVSASIRRLDAGVPAELDFERRSGVTIEELDSRLPPSRHGSVPSVRELVGNSAAQSARTPNRRKRGRHGTWYTAAAIAAVATATVLSLQLLSNALTPPATAWLESEPVTSSRRVGLAARGAHSAGSPEGHHASTRAVSDLGLAWSELKSARRTFFGFFPRYHVPGVRNAAAGFERAARYPSLPDAIRAEAIYGEAMTFWLVGDRSSAIRTLSNPAFEFSALADRSRDLRARLESSGGPASIDTASGHFRVP